jgi:hypothetical protein
MSNVQIKFILTSGPQFSELHPGIPICKPTPLQDLAKAAIAVTERITAAESNAASRVTVSRNYGL